ncbi:MAG: hypothetical protein AB1798_02175 [Spirochaetota bacterium]
MFQTLLFTAVINFLILLLIFLFFKNKINTALKSSVMLDQIREEVNQMIIELNQTTSRNIGLIEEKLKQLSELLSKTDKSIIILNRELDKNEMRTSVYERLKPKGRPIEERAEGLFKPVSVQDRVIQLYREGISSNIIASRLNTTVGEVELIIALKEKGLK